MIRIAFWQRGAAPQAYRPLLLDQVSSQALDRLATERWGDAPAERTPRVQSRHGSAFSKASHILLPVGMLGFGGLITAGMVYGSIDTLTNGEGVSWLDALRVGVMALLSLLFLGQLTAFARRLPGVSRLTRRLHGRPLPPPPPPLLDQVSAHALLRIAPDDLGAASAGQLLAARGRQMLDTGSWLLLVLIVVGVAAFMGAGAAFGAWSAFGQGGIGVPAFLQLLFLSFTVGGLLLIAALGLHGLRERRKRRRSRLLRRLLRFLLRGIDSGRRVVSDVAGVSNRVNDAALVRSGGTSFLQQATPVVNAAGGSLGGGSVAATTSALAAASTGTAPPSPPFVGPGITGSSAGPQASWSPGPGGSGGAGSPPGGGGGGLVPHGGSHGGGLDLGGDFLNPGGGGDGGDFALHGNFLNPGGGGDSGDFALHGNFLNPGGSGGGGDAHVYGGGGLWGGGAPQPNWIKSGLLTLGVLIVAFMPFVIDVGPGGSSAGAASDNVGAGGGSGGGDSLAPSATNTPTPTLTATVAATEAPPTNTPAVDAPIQATSRPQPPSRTPQPSATITPQPSNTPQPTRTPTPTNTAKPTNTVRPTRTPTPCVQVPGGPACP